MPKPTALDAAAVVRRYVDELHHRRNVEVIRDVVADPTIRHEPGGETQSLTLADSLSRATELQDQFAAMHFSEVVFFAAGTDVCWVFDGTLTRPDGQDVRACGAEVFRVVDGKITEVWNPASTPGVWG